MKGNHNNNTIFHDEEIYLKLFGIKLISFKKGKYGVIKGTGLLNPLLEKLRLIPMIYLQAKFYKKYDNLGTWKGKRVANTFAPPVGSKPQFRAIKGLIKSHLLGRAFPLAMTYAVTYRCQCNCIHCSAGFHRRFDTPELTTDEAKKLIDESQELGIIILAFTGGEPLLRKDIYELIAHVDQNKTMPIMFTNGYLLNEENAEKLAEAGLYSIFISLDSPVAEEHDEMRGIKGLFERAIDGIKLMKSRGVFVGISSYATRTGTAKGIYKKLYMLGKELGVHNILLFDAVPTGKMLKDTGEMLTEKQREEILEFSRYIFSHKEVPPIMSQVWQNSVEGNLSGIGCLAANIQYYVSAYGDVAPCDFTPLSFGNIRQESLRKIWRKMIHHPAYKHRSCFCRMQHPAFRHFYIDPIPVGFTLPYPIDRLPRIDYRKQIYVVSDLEEKSDKEKVVGSDL